MLFPLRPAASPVLPAPRTTSRSTSWVYEVRPSRELPTLDLSITFKSHVLHPALLHLYDRFLSHHTVHLVAYIITTLLYILVAVTPTHVAQTLSVVGFITGLPGTFEVLGSLRSDTIKVLLRTYDIIFFGTIVIAALVTLMIMLRDARALIVLQSLLAFQINIFTDANIQFVRRIAAVNAFAAVCTAFVASCVALDIIPNLRHFTIIGIGSHRFEARDVVTNGFVTVLAIMVRNTYRKRALLLRRSKGSVVDCVSYRCSLMLQQVSTGESQPPTVPPHPLPHIQTMRYVPCFPLIHAAHVVVPRCFSWLTTSLSPRSGRLKRLFFRWLGFSAAVLAITNALYDFVNFKLAMDPSYGQQLHARRVIDSSTAMSTAFVLTVLYTMSCFMLCQRDLLMAIFSSFDFIFLSTQLTFVHLAIADFFRWQGSCMLLIVTWLWSHWVFTIDALTPPVRERIGYSSLFLKMVVTALVVSTSILNHLLLFSEATVDIHNRVIWSGRILGEPIEFRMLATFYSTFVTVLAWALRLFWRVSGARPNELVMADGPVAYDNYLRLPPKLPSRSKRLTLPSLSVWKSIQSRRSITPAAATPKPTREPVVNL